MSIDVSWYDVTALDWAVDGVDTGAIIQSTTGTWKPLAQEYKTARFTEMQNRVEHRGNLQTLSIDKRVKKWCEIQLEYIAEKYDANSPAYGWWDLISQAFWGGATGAPVTRPSTAWIGATINRTTPEYWLIGGVKIEQVIIKGSMVDGVMTVGISAIGRAHQFTTATYVQGTATQRAASTKAPIVPSNDVTITVNAIDVSTVIQDFTLTLTRGYEKRGRSATVAASGTQIGTDGENYREFVPTNFDGKLELTLDPYGTTTANLIDYLADTALGTVSISAENATNGKTITFSASKTKTADQDHAEGVAPSVISLAIDGSTFGLTTN